MWCFFSKMPFLGYLQIIKSPCIIDFIGKEGKHMKKNMTLETEPIESISTNDFNEFKDVAVYELKDTSIVSKSHKLIMSQLDFSVMEQKIFLMALAAYRESVEKGQETLEFKFSANEIRKLFDTSSNSIYKKIEDTADRLTSHRIAYKEDEENFTYVVPIPYADYNGGELTVRLEKSMREALSLSSKTYRVDMLLGNFKNLKSKYSIRIYELLKMYLSDNNIDSRDGWKSITMDVIEFKLMIGAASMIDGENGKKLVKDSYPRPYNFKQSVLDKSKGELEECTDILFDYELTKNGNGDPVITLKTIDRLNYHEKEMSDVNVIPSESDGGMDAFVEIFTMCTTLFEGKNINANQIKEIVVASHFNFSIIRTTYKFLKRMNCPEDKLYESIMDELLHPDID